MCGICGIYNSNSKKRIEEVFLKKMTRILSHRGPDDEGFYIKENIGLGNRRLSIIDLSLAGHQPMTNEDGTLWITYNGEIYNFVELRKELEKFGHIFKSNSDTEVILHAFEEWGTDCLNKFNGMWAFAIWDERKKTLFCSRDRFGIKPFYYYFDGKVFAFASEIKALLCCPFIKREPNEKVIYDYLTIGVTDYSGETFFENIKQLEPGHYLILNGNNLKIEKYYQPPFNSEFGEFRENECQELSQKFIELLEDSIKLRFRSDVEIGACLSGGLDSSTIVGLADRLLKKEEIAKEVIGNKLKTFSSCSGDLRFDERKYIEKVIKKVELEPHYTFPSSDEFWRDINDLVWAQEEPFRSVSIYGHWRVMKLAKEKKMKVLLIGEGGDELFGYPEQTGSYFAQMLLDGRILSFFKELKEVKKMKGFPEVKRNIFFLFNQISRYFLSPAMILFLRKKAVGDLSYINRNFFKKFEYDERISRWARLNFQQLLWERVTKFGLRGLLNFEDKNSMAFSIENRPPFLDYRLVELLFSLPAVYKIHNGWTKYLFRIGVKDFLPEDICWRKDKEGFLTPALIWLRNNKENIREIFKAKDFKSDQYLNRKIILDRFDEAFIKCNEKSPEIWKLISLELWLKKMF